MSGERQEPTTKAVIELEDGTFLRLQPDGTYAPVTFDKEIAALEEQPTREGRPRRKTSIHLRVDPHMLDWYRSHGKGYLTLMHAVLMAFYEHNSKGK